MPNKLVMPPPNPKQAQALRETHRYVGYGGARGGGKSWFVRWKAVLLCLRYPGIKILITRRTYKELFNNHIAPLCQLLAGIARYNKTEKLFRFPNGSTIAFGYCAAAADLGQYQGAEYDVWFADEAGQFREDWLTQIDACVRGVNPFPKRTYYTLNPGGPSHGYFKRLFLDRRFRPDEHPEDYTFIQALVSDNAALQRSQPEYLRALEKLPPKLRKAWLEGSWDVFDGQFFEEFRDDPAHYRDRRFTHVIEPFEIPAGWKLYRSFDWGYHRPFSCGWWAVDYDGVVYRILELYGCTGTPNEGVRWPPDQVFPESAGSSGSTGGWRGSGSWALPTLPSGTGKRERALRTPPPGIRCIFHPGTTSGCPGGCSCTTGCNLTATDCPCCMCSGTAPRS